MSIDYETFRQHQERYEREKADRDDAEKWRHEQESRKASRSDPEPKKDEHEAVHEHRVDG